MLALKIALENGKDTLRQLGLEEEVEAIVEEIRQIEEKITQQIEKELTDKVVRVAKTPTLPYLIIELKEGIALASRYDTYAIEEVYTDNNELKELIELIQKDPAINKKVTTKIIKTHNIEEHTPEIIEEDDKKEEWREVKTYIHDSYPVGIFLKEVEPLYGKIMKKIKVRHSGPETTTIITLLARPNTILRVKERVAYDGYIDKEKIYYVGKRKTKLIKEKIINTYP